MKYIGSKRRLAKHILPIICKNRRWDQWYVEPFVGGGNSISEVRGKRIGSDINKYLIEALKLIRDKPETLPKNNKEFTESDYKAFIRGEKVLSDGLKGIVGFTYSFGSKWRGGWAKNAKGRDYVEVTYNNAIKQSGKLKGCELICCSYDELEIPANAIIYCDPTYIDATNYGFKFDHNRFWDWVRNKVKEGHEVFISEYKAPEDFECIFEKEILCTINGNQKRVERLFKMRK